MERAKNLSSSIFPENLKDQIAILSLYFPRIKVPQEIPYTSAFGFIRWESIAKNYPAALKMMIEAFKRNFEVHLEVDLKKVEREEIIETKQDVFWGKVNFFENFSAQTVKKIVKKAKKENFSLGIFEVGCLILTHSERFSKSIGFNCIGDRYQEKGLMRASVVYHPWIYVSDNQIRIGFEWEGVVKIDYLTPVFRF